MSGNNSLLRPGWYKGSGAGGGKGFQPPPTASDRGDKGRSNSTGSGSENESRRDSNKFAALLDDDDGVVDGGSGVVHTADSSSKPPPVISSSRSEAFRSSFNRASSTGSKIGGSGRSLADLAARVPESSSGGHRRHSAYDGPKGGSGRFSHLHSGDGMPGTSIENYKPDPKVVRYTREKLLALRPRDDPGPPEEIKLLQGSVIVSPVAQDPVCWDSLDAEDIWEMAREQRRSSAIGPGGKSVGSGLECDPRRRNISSSGRWQRGVALPPPEDASRRKERDAENPNELWDDPVGGVTGAASDFSSFGALPLEDDDLPFDFDKMTEASAKLEKELHGERSKDADDDGLETQSSKKIDVSRPLATAGTTLLSGSGNDVSVFEDFDTPVTSDAEEPEPENSKQSENEEKATETAAVRGGDEDPNASSRLMKMIGVIKDTNDDGSELNKDAIKSPEPSSNPWGSSIGVDSANTTTTIDPIIGALGGGSSTGTSISLNPWGDPIIPSSSSQPLSTGTGGMNLGIHLSSYSVEQKNREAQLASERENVARREAELLRQQQEEEEKQRRAMAQKNAEERARQQQTAMQQQQESSSQQSQIEQVLMGRICTILENSWGRADLVSILTTLHSEDSRVIPLLNNIESLRALIARSPHRVSLRSDSGLGGEMAVLILTNAQWQEQKEHQARIQHEELRRRQIEEEAKARMQAQNRLVASIKEDAPWYYSDPQNNIQGPFRGEEMRQWLEAGYFKGDLPISQVPGGPFHQLCNWFPNLSSAFTVQSPKGQDGNNTNEELEERQRKEAPASAAAERKRLAEEANAQKVAAEKKQAEERAIAAAADREREGFEHEKAQNTQNANVLEVHKASSNGGNQSSTQLKMMLGLSSGDHSLSEKQIVNETVDEKKATKTQRNSEKKSSTVADKKPTTKTVNKNEPALRLETNIQLTPSDPNPPAPAPAPAASAWGSATNNKPRKSMSEIQKEEARAAAILAAKRGSIGQSSSSGWANVAAGSTGWSSGTIRPLSTQNVTSVASVRSSQIPLKPQTNGHSGATRKASTSIQSQRAAPTSSTTPAEEFGTTMSPTLEKWCKEKMQQINGSDDLTLVAFCMTLNDANEIRQYLTTYLGLTPQVNNFATEFINKRGLGGKQEEWETLGSAKKSRKKKSGR